MKEELDREQLELLLAEANKALEAKEELEKDREILTAALFNLVPMVISNNLTENTYVMMNYDHFTTKKAEQSGNYDELIKVGASTVPDEQKESFERTFGRKNVLDAYNRGEKSVRLEHQQWGDDGILRWIDTTSIFVNPKTDGNLYSITLAQDITERKEQNLKLEKALQEATEATKAKSEFLSRMSHEIRTPMNAIMGMTAIAQDNKANYMQVSECLNKINLSSHYLLTLLNDMLEMSRIESGVMEIINSEFDFSDLADGIGTIVETLAVQNDIRYECINKSDPDYHYFGDRMRIQQVLVNIINNALKFTKSGGRVRFTIESEDKGDELSMFHFTIADTGIGMSEEFMKRMFRPFTQEDGSNTSRYEGSGLGLAISQNLARLMGGSIKAESFLGIGTTFWVDIPLKRMPKTFTHITTAPQTKSERMNESRLKGCQILMAEDHPMNVMIARKLLENKGVIVTVADNGKIAVDMFEASREGFYDAILMDIRMPVMDGLEAARTIRQLGRKDASTVPIIAMTANALEEDRRLSKEAGMDAHLAKPFEPKQLYEMLLSLIN